MTFSEWWQKNGHLIKQEAIDCSIYFIDKRLENWFRNAWFESFNHCIDILKYQSNIQSTRPVETDRDPG